MSGNPPAIEIVDELVICRSGRCAGYPFGPHADYAEALTAARAHWAQVHGDQQGLAPLLVRTYAACVAEGCEREGRSTYRMCYRHSEMERKRRRLIRDAEYSAYVEAHGHSAFIPSAPHGEVRGYSRGCRCDHCRQAMADYRRERRSLKAGAA